MADQNPEATPETGTPEENLYEKRYNDLRSEYDRLQNRVNNPDSRRQLFDELASEYGYTLDEGDNNTETEEYEDPYADPYEARMEKYEKELAAMQQQWQTYTTQQQQNQAIQFAEAYSEDRLDELQVADERTREWIVSRATAMPALEHEGQIVPDIDAAHNEYKELVAAEHQRWAQSKADIPHTPTGGTENTGVPAWSDDPEERANDRLQWMMNQASNRGT